MHICWCSLFSDLTKLCLTALRRRRNSLRNKPDLHKFQKIQMEMESMWRYMKYKVDREVLDEERLQERAQRKTYSDTHPSLTQRLKDSLR